MVKMYGKMSTNDQRKQRKKEREANFIWLWRAGERAEEEGEYRGQTLPGAAPVEFHRRWRQRESVTATERQREKEEEEEEEGKKRKNT